ncbi:MAG: folate-binding protein [Micropepsaceae bacterium]
MTKAAILSDRTILKLSGPESPAFLQGLITSDVQKLRPANPIYAALLTPQGKIICDFLLSSVADDIYLDCAIARSVDLASRLKKYRLRAKVTIEDQSKSLVVLAASEAPRDPKLATTAFADPRSAALGFRWIMSRENLDASLAHLGIELEPGETYERHRIECAIPDSVRDLQPETYFPLDCNFEELHGVDFEKGCYVGQELTSRMKHRATSRRRILPVAATEPLPPTGTRIVVGDIDVGEMLGSLGPNGLAQIRLDKLADAEFATAGALKIRIGRPPYPLTV